MPAPCPVPVKRAMIDWWGPIILEYYSATEAMGMTLCDSAEMRRIRGTVGKSVFGELHVLDDAMREVPAGQTGKLWFKTASPFEYFNDPVRTAEVNSPDGSMSTLGDIGHVDEEGYVYLTDRATFMIISGGVNIIRKSAENVLITHPKVVDAAVFGVPNEEMGRGEGGRAAHAGRCARSGDGGRADRALAANISPITNARARSTSRLSCRGSRPASFTRRAYANGIGRAIRAASFE